jgi:oxygen-independent coproporphyrinogen-3 oxidase
LSAVNNRFRVDDNAEITMEMNPGTVDPDLLKQFRALGVNRASFGAQTFDDKELAKLGRSHTTADTLKTFSDLRSAGFDNISFDLIAGLPGQHIGTMAAECESSIGVGAGTPFVLFAGSSRRYSVS